MKKKIQLLPIAALAALLQFGCADSLVKSQTTNSADGSVGRTGVEPIRPKDEARIFGEFERVKLEQTTEEAVKRQPAPRFFLMFQCADDEINCINGERRQELPDDAQKLIDDYWKHLLDDSYEMLTAKRNYMNYDTYTRLDNKHLAVAVKFKKSMRKTKIDAPAGKREMSENEVSQIMLASNDKACQTVQQSDTCEQFDVKQKGKWRMP